MESRRRGEASFLSLSLLCSSHLSLADSTSPLSRTLSSLSRRSTQQQTQLRWLVLPSSSSCSPSSSSATSSSSPLSPSPIPPFFLQAHTDPSVNSQRLDRPPFAFARSCSRRTAPPPRYHRCLEGCRGVRGREEAEHARCGRAGTLRAVSPSLLSFENGKGGLITCSWTYRKGRRTLSPLRRISTTSRSRIPRRERAVRSPFLSLFPPFLVLMPPSSSFLSRRDHRRHQGLHQARQRPRGEAADDARVGSEGAVAFSRSLFVLFPAIEAVTDAN